MANMLETIITFLGGGIVGAGIQYVSVARTAREKRHSDYVYRQMNNLYGPLYFLSSQNERLFDLNNRIMSAYTEHFSGNKWSQDYRTQKSLENESTATIELSNEYICQVKENNKQIIKILRDGYALINIDDIDIMQEFVVESIRMNKEIDDKRLKNIPLEIYKKIGDISYSRPDFLSCIKQRFTEMQMLLKHYH
jgi:predicted  nucleic acid-binding Zn-ribbon protein